MGEKLFVVIVSFNSAKDIKDCLASIKISSGKIKPTIVLVDNASWDNSVKLVKEVYPEAVVISNSSNRGFAAAINLGVDYALGQGADYIFLINPDAVIKKGNLDNLVQISKLINMTGIVAPVLIDRGKKKYYVLGQKLNTYLGRTKHIRVEKLSKVINEQEMVSGCAMLIRKEVFAKVDKFDERFFMYFEDSDFCLRTRKAGFKIRIDPRMLVCHKLNPKMGKEKIYKIKNLLNANSWFIKKYIAWYFWPLAYIYLGLLGVKMLFAS